MKPMNKAAIRISLSVLLSGVVGVLGMLIMSYAAERMSYYYDKMSQEYYVNREYIADIREELYEHQSTVVSYTVATGEKRKDYGEQESRLRDSLRDTIVEFGELPQSNEAEFLYHKVYSNYIGYIRNVDIALKLSNEGKDATAGIYITTSMAEFVGKINGNLEELNQYTKDELNETKIKMDTLLDMTDYGTVVLIVFIVLAVAICLFYCTKITNQLEHYKDDLEREVRQQTSELRSNMEKMEKIQNNTIIGMANLIENRDGDTGGHIKRTGSYVELLARAAQEEEAYKDILTDSYIELLVKAAPMHDIGKIAVPDNILKKPGKLEPEEFESIKTHAAEGGRIIREVLGGVEEQEYVDIAVQMACGHHEKWDGSGYPLGQKGEEIPLCARIMALADVFDALVSPRCYKEPFEPNRAFQIILDSAGTHFDPLLTKLFVGMKMDILQILASEGEQN